MVGLSGMADTLRNCTRRRVQNCTRVPVGNQYAAAGQYTGGWCCCLQVTTVRCITYDPYADGGTQTSRTSCVTCIVLLLGSFVPTLFLRCLSALAHVGCFSRIRGFL